MRTESCAEGRSQTAAHRQTNTAEDFSHFGKISSAAFLVYVAAVLFYKPIFTQPLGFVLCAAGAVEKVCHGWNSKCSVPSGLHWHLENQRSVPHRAADRSYPRSAAPFTFVHVLRAQRLLLYHVPSQKTIAFLTKDTRKNFPH